MLYNGPSTRKSIFIKKGDEKIMAKETVFEPGYQEQLREIMPNVIIIPGAVLILQPIEESEETRLFILKPYPEDKAVDIRVITSHAEPTMEGTIEAFPLEGQTYLDIKGGLKEVDSREVLSWVRTVRDRLVLYKNAEFPQLLSLPPVLD